MTTLVIQSHRAPLPHGWLAACLASVRDWSSSRRYHYRFVGDELFQYLPSDIGLRRDISSVIKSDLARLKYLQAALKDFAAVVWLDADVLVFDRENFELPLLTCAVGRENWQQRDAKGKLKNYRKVHNAAMLFRQGNSLLDFYCETAERLLRANTTAMPAQFIGPKLLSALHNVAQLPVWEQAGMMSPLLGQDLLDAGDGKAIECLQRHQIIPLAAVNLCSSSVVRGDLSDAQMVAIIERLLTSKRI